MEKWTTQSIKEYINGLCILMDSNYNAQKEVEFLFEDNQGRIADRKDDNTIIISERLINDPGMHKEIIKAAFGYIAAIKVLEANRKENVAINFEEACREFFKKADIKFFTDIEIEDAVRPVRRSIFPDPLNGGSYFCLGDVIKERQLGMGLYIYEVADIEYQQDGDIYVTFKHYNKKEPKYFTEAEKAVYDEFHLIDAESWPWKMLS